MKKYIIILAIIIAVGVCYFASENHNEYEFENIYLEANTVEDEISIIKIHIIGEVINSGMYAIEEGSRIDDAIKIAGGATDLADLNKINLAYELSDGEKIYVPSIYDEADEYTVISENSNTKININKANSEELQVINGIGPTLAENIINYREENGKFYSIEDLKEVSGIGEKKFETIKEFIDIK